MMSYDFELEYEKETRRFSSKTRGFGEYYPYRDACNKNGDPVCRNSSVLYYETSFRPKKANSTLVVRASGVDDVILNQTVSTEEVLHLHKKDIECSGGNVYSVSVSCHPQSSMRKGMREAVRRVERYHKHLRNSCLSVSHLPACNLSQQHHGMAFGHSLVSEDGVVKP